MRAFDSANTERPYEKKNNLKHGIVKKKVIEKPPCETCRPELMHGNYPAVVIYGKVKDQVIPAGMNGTPVALRHDSIWCCIDRFKYQLGVDDECELFDKVVDLYRIIIGEKAIASSSNIGRSDKG